MKPEQARALVTETFPQPFDKGRFHHFVKELLNGFDETKAAPMQVPEAFAPHVRSCARLGTYESPDRELADVLIVHTTEPWKLERTRTALRDFVAHKLKRGDSYKEAGLVAFVAPDARSWRFSFVRMEYESRRDPKTGKIAVEERLTPARRFSYIVGENESCHTAQSRFLELLQDTETKPPLAKIEEAFSVETVTDEFFRQYKELFLGLKDELDKLAKNDPTIAGEFAAKKVSTADFAKKLMGQIVFLYFLQKKGWLGVPKGGDWGGGPHNFLRQLFDGKFRSYKNFFNDILEHLFYDTLATDRKHEAWCDKFKCRIPFLNGGLFEPLRDYDWQKTDIIIPNRIFANSDFVEQGVTGTGILDVFDRYNFTVNEAEPLEKEVAIDPEMLGKVFENLLGVAERKSKGSFYTPREIVHYMCQESLINYLDTAVNFHDQTLTPALSLSERERENCSQRTDKSNASIGKDAAKVSPSPGGEGRGEGGRLISRADIETFIHSGDQASHYEAARVDGTSGKRQLPKSIETHARLIDEKLATITVCDPAVGSGAYPVGMMQEIVRARSALTPYFSTLSPREERVGREPERGANQDSSSPRPSPPSDGREGEVSQRTAYHFKRHAIQNCLYGVDIDPGAVEIAKLRLWLSLVVDEEDVKRIKPLPNLFYKIVTGNSLLGVEKNLFNQQLFQKLEKLKPLYFDQSDQSEKAALRRQIDQTIHELTNGKEAFDFEIYFSEVFHRKGGFDVVVGNPPYVRIQELKKADARTADVLKATYASASKGNYDLYVVFVEKGLQLLNGGGQFAFILPHKFFNAQYGEPLREVISRGKHLRHVVHFGDQQIFSGATNYVCLLFLAKAGAETCRWVRADDLPAWLQTFRAPETELAAVRVTASEWNFAVGKSSTLFEKLERLPTKLGNVASMFVGLQTSADTVFLFKKTIGVRGAVSKVWSKELDQEVQIENALLKPVIRSGKIGRFWATPTASVLFPYELENGSARLFSDKELRHQFPLAWKYLLANKGLLQEREHGKFADQWWQLYPKNLEHWEEPKIMLPYMITELAAFYDEGGNYFVNVTTGGFGLRLQGSQFSSRFVTALLNSQVLDWYLKKVSTTFHGGYFAANKQFLVQLPIPAAPPQKQKAVERLVDRILAAKQSRPVGKADTSAWEREIDELVYALYGLTPEEIQIVEGAAK